MVSLFMTGMGIVTILILIDGFLQSIVKKDINTYNLVTILILIDGFLQYLMKYLIKTNLESHNPYFNRWFSAITKRDSRTGLRKQSQSLF